MDDMKVLLQVICIGMSLVDTAESLENLAQDISYRGKASQSSVYFDGSANADKAVDGHLEESGKDYCSFTRSKDFKAAWWKFTLIQTTNVAYLQIFLRKGTVNRHIGFNVFVFNASSYTPGSAGGIKVYTQKPSSCLNQVMNVTVNKITKGIAIYNSKSPPLITSCNGYEPTFATIEICEVMVMGCHFHQYGESCKNCSLRCLNRLCDAFNGSCIYGCSKRFIEPPDCMICKDGYYGHNCEKTCGKCKIGTICQKITGICPRGCQNHWNGSKCDVCENDFYGDSCEEKCGHCKPETNCNRSTAICHQGCEDHWDSDKCNGL
ncbi:scavenger receptor class F member 1-like [Saccostrea cucullata]|uniref:scavenger receptor class F member 1-like n=1 Tax=Saccostrea cuccullata TaxID=36930 RepID=UPI002ECFEEB9